MSFKNDFYVNEHEIPCTQLAFLVLFKTDIKLFFVNLD